MKKTSKKLGALVLASLICITAVPTFAGNTSYSFSLKTTTSAKGSSARKDDSEKYAYLTVSNMSQSVSTNFRVRTSSDSEATYMQTVSGPSSQTHSLQYKFVPTVGAYYYIWANLSSAQSSTVTISGIWCP